MKVVNGLKEYALGEKFVHDGFEYICIPDPGCCVDCDFHEVPVFCNNPNDLACLTQERSDSYLSKLNQKIKRNERVRGKV